MAYENIPLQVNSNEHKFEITIDDQKAFIDYKQGGKKVYLIHTEVPSGMGGKGIGKALVEKTLVHLEENHLTLVPMCAFVQYYIQKHPAWNRILANEE